MKFSDDVYAVILAGGSGTRFWPKSRQRSPKQLCAIGHSEQTMIELTLSRLEGLVPPERRLIVTHADQLAATRAIVGERCPLILAEPEARNTAAALALAAMAIDEKAAGRPATMISLHADHVIRDLAAFNRLLQQGVEVAKDGYLVLIGVVPTYAETGYGYIEKGSPLAASAYRVAAFREKPDRATATEFLQAQGRFLWNSGLFIWRTATLRAELATYLPEALTILTEAQRLGPLCTLTAEQLAPFYRRLPKVPVDQAILEKSRNAAVLAGDFGWQDVGSWAALDQCFPADADGNLIYGDSMALECKGTTVDSDGPFIAALGLENMVVVAAKGAVLVCPKDRAQDVKRIVDGLASQGRKELL